MEKGIKELLIDELHDLLSAEQQIIKALPNIARAAESEALKIALALHLKETKGQVVRLAKIFKILKIQKKQKFCRGMDGLIHEATDVLKEFKTKSFMRDAAIISKVQRIEHYEIAAYGTARTFAQEIGLSDVADLLQETLDEEGNADRKLTKLAEGGFLTSGINYKANKPEKNNKPHGAKPRLIKAKAAAKAKPRLIKAKVTAKTKPRLIKAKLAAKAKPRLIKAKAKAKHVVKKTKRAQKARSTRPLASRR